MRRGRALRSATAGLTLVAAAAIAGWFGLTVLDTPGPGPDEADGWARVTAGGSAELELEAGRHLLLWHVRYAGGGVNCDNAPPDPPDDLRLRIVDIVGERELEAGDDPRSSYCGDPLSGTDVHGQTIGSVELPRTGRYRVEARTQRPSSGEFLAIGSEGEPVSERLGLGPASGLWRYAVAAGVLIVVLQGVALLLELRGSRPRA